MTLPSPKYYWNFNERSGATAMASVGDATIVTDRESFVPGRRGNGLRFNPKDGVRLATTTLPALPPPWTAAFWVKREADSEAASLFSSLEYAVKLEQWPNTHRLGLTEFGHADASFNCTAPLGEWVHLALVGTGAGTRLYINGALQGSVARAINLGLKWLGSTGGYVEHASMILDEIKIFDEALTDAQVAELLSQMSEPVEHLVVFEWTCDASASEKEAAAQALAGLVGQIEGIIAYVGGPQISTEDPGKDWHFGFRMTFRDVAARDVYVDHPKHLEVIAQYLKPILKKVVVFDIQH